MKLSLKRRRILILAFILVALIGLVVFLLIPPSVPEEFERIQIGMGKEETETLLDRLFERGHFRFSLPAELLSLGLADGGRSSLNSMPTGWLTKLFGQQNHLFKISR